MVNTYGTSMLDVMDSPDCVRKLSKVDLIAHTSAVKFKQHWDASRGISSCLPAHIGIHDALMCPRLSTSHTWAP